MDRLIEEEVSRTKKRKLIWIIVAAVAVTTLLILLLRNALYPSVEAKFITIATVEQGSIENSLNASGEVLPEFEETISSPISASIESVNLLAGSPIKAGESILTLNKTATETELEKLKFQYEARRNELQKLKLNLQKSFYDLQSNAEVKQLRINSLKADVENAKRLFNAGGGTREDIEKAELSLKVALLEKQQLENDIRTKQQTMQVEMKEAGIAAEIQQSDVRELQRKLTLAHIVASRNGVITWLNRNIGTRVNEGEALARIADLSSYKVQASIADVHLNSLQAGQQARVKIGDSSLKGTVVNIQPAVQNNLVSFDLQLEDGNNHLLRPNMKVDVFIITQSKPRVLLVKNGPAFKGAATVELFVVQGKKAFRKTIQTGLSNFDFIQLIGDIKEGDRVIISDMSNFKNASEITIK